MSESKGQSVRGIVEKVGLGVVSSDDFPILVYERRGLRRLSAKQDTPWAIAITERLEDFCFF